MRYSAAAGRWAGLIVYLHHRLTWAEAPAWDVEMTEGLDKGELGILLESEMEPV